MIMKNTPGLSDIQVSGLTKLTAMNAEMCDELGDLIAAAQDGDRAAVIEARTMLLLEAEFTEAELGMFAVFDEA